MTAGTASRTQVQEKLQLKMRLDEHSIKELRGSEPMITIDHQDWLHWRWNIKVLREGCCVIRFNQIRCGGVLHFVVLTEYFHCISISGKIRFVSINDKLKAMSCQDKILQPVDVSQHHNRDLHAVLQDDNATLTYCHHTGIERMEWPANSLHFQLNTSGINSDCCIFSPWGGKKNTELLQSFQFKVRTILFFLNQFPKSRNLKRWLMTHIGIWW